MRAHVITIAAALTLVACGRSPAPETSVPRSEPPPAVQSPPLMPGMGNHHHAIATASPEAQRYFDQGFDLVFGFNHEEAVRSFKRAAELDPKAPMPHWGIAWALGPNYNLDVDDERAKQANAAIAQALALSKGGPAAERGVRRGHGDQVSDRSASRTARRWRANTPMRCAICRADIPTISMPRRSTPRA